MIIKEIVEKIGFLGIRYFKVKVFRKGERRETRESMCAHATRESAEQDAEIKSTIFKNTKNK